MKLVERLRGMHDLSEESCQQRRELQDRLQDLIGRHGYRLLEMPLLEPTELFLRKSGGELASQMYSFTDAGSNPVSLRPEFTSPIMRHFLEHRSEVELPARWQYAGPVFRYEVAHPEGSGQFTQVGAELIGSGSALADVELLTLAAQVPARAGLSGCTVEVADLDVVHSILDAVGISDRARTYIVGSIAQLRQGSAALDQVLDRARQLRLVGESLEEAELGAAVVGLGDDQARQVLRGFFRWNAGETPRLGQRDPEQVVERLLRKLRGSDDAGKMERALTLIGDLVARPGEPEAALESARQVVRQAGANPAALDRLSDTLGLVLAGPDLGVRYRLDFGLARGLAYYNGIVFQVRHHAWPGSLGGGGRYDALARALGAEETVPACGFAYTLETLLALTEAPAVPAERSASGGGTLVSAEDATSRGSAWRVALELRQEERPVELDVLGRDLSECLRYAGERGLGRVVMVRAEGEPTIHQVERS